MKKLTVLCDNNTLIDHYLLAEPALSFLVEADGKKVLFDFGYSDVYLKNAETLNLDLNEVDCAVLSHGHNDHTGGMQYWNCRRIPLIAHPDCLNQTMYCGLEIGSPLNENQIREKFELKLTKEPYWLSESLCFLGEIPTAYDFEKRTAIGKKLRDEWEDDFVMEDSALALITEKGLWIITGCSHAGICSIIAYAQHVTGLKKIAGVIGGFHLLKQDDRLFKTIEELNQFEIECLIPCHCVNLKSKIAMSKTLEIMEAGSGVEIVFEK